MGVSRVTDLTVDELRALIREEMQELVREAVREALVDLAGDDVDPDAGLEFKPEIAARLRAFQQGKMQGRLLDDVVREMSFADC